LSACLLALFAASVAHPAAPPPPRVDTLGDPLPRGALARLGTTRFRQRECNALAISPDGTLAAASDDGKVRLWALPSGRAWGVLDDADVTSLAFSPDGRSLASSDGRLVRLWNVAEKKRVWAVDSAGVLTIAFAPDGKTVVAVRFRQGFAFHDAKDGKLAAELSDPECCIGTALAPDGKTMAAGRSNGDVVLWDLVKQREIGLLEGHKAHPYGLAFSRDGKVLASTSLDGSLRIWDVATRTVRRRVLTDRVGSHALLFTDDGKKLLAFSHARKVVRLDVKSGKAAIVWQDERHPISRIVFSADGRSAIFTSAAGPQHPRLLDLGQGREVSAWPGQYGHVTGIEYSPDGGLVATCSGTDDDRSIRLWDAASGRPVRELRERKGSVFAVAFSPDGRTLASGATDGTVGLWDVATGRRLRTLEGHIGEVLTVFYSPDGGTLASGSVYFDRRARWRAETRLWDVAEGKLRHVLSDPHREVYPRRFGHGGRTMFTTGSGGASGTRRLGCCSAASPVN
jgi:WD40 repeat protein